MLKGHTYPKFTSVRCPDTKRGYFMLQFEKLLHGDFEGGVPVATRFGVLHRPPRRVLREMAWAWARKRAAEDRAAQHKAIVLPPSQDRRIIIPDMSKALAKPGKL